MRGRGQSARSPFRYVALEERVPQRNPLRRIRFHRGRGSRGAVSSFRGVVLEARPAFGAAGAPASGAAAPGSLEGAQ